MENTTHHRRKMSLMHSIVIGAHKTEEEEAAEQ